MQVSVAITKLKQQIANLQNQIAAQQAVYVKQQAAQHGGGCAGGGVPGGLGGSNDYLRGGNGGGGDGISGPHDPIGQLQGQFTNMTMNNKVCVFYFMLVTFKN